MLQINIWAGLAELGVGANIQHYNPVNRPSGKRHVPGTRWLSPYCTDAIWRQWNTEREPKEKEDISARVTVAGND